MNSIPSLSNPPNAPKRTLLRQRRGSGAILKLVFPDADRPKLPEWKVLYESGRVRERYLHLTPEDIGEIDDMDTLMDLQERYFPSSQPRNLFEEAYLRIMQETIAAKMYIL